MSNRDYGEEPIATCEECHTFAGRPSAAGGNTTHIKSSPVKDNAMTEERPARSSITTRRHWSGAADASYGPDDYMTGARLGAHEVRETVPPMLGRPR